MLNLKMSRKKRDATLAVLAISGLILAGFLLKCHFTQSATIDEDPPLVRSMVVYETEAMQSYSYPGEVRGRHESQLAFQVGGKIVRRYVELGSIVKRGQILMQIDPEDIQQMVNGHAAQVASTKSQLHLAENNLKRYRKLYEEDVVSRAQFDRYLSAYEVAQAIHEQVAAQYAQGANQLGYTSLRADQAGVVSGISAEAGQVVGPGQIVITLVREEEREAEINVPENRIQELGKANRIHVSFWALPDMVVEGKIREIAPMADPITRTYRVRISLMNPPLDIKLGMTVSVAINYNDQYAVTLIPLSAVYQTKETPCVWILQDGSVRLREIKIMQFGDGQVQVLSGIRSGETIVTAGVHKLREGTKVRSMEGGKL